MDGSAGRDAARWHAVLDAGAAAWAIYAADGTLKSTNARMGEMFSVTEEQAAMLIGNYNILKDEQQQKAGIDGHVRRAFDGEKVDFPITRYVVEPVDGGESYVRWVRGSMAPVFGADGELQEVILMLLDVTDIESARDDVEEQRQSVERQLQEVEHLYDTSPIGLCFFDREMRFVRINAKLAEFNGQPQEAHIGRTLREVLGDAPADQLEPLHAQVLETGRPILHREIEGPPVEEGGGPCTWLVSYHPLWGDDGSIDGVGTVVEDITTTKEAERALRESEERFQEMATHVRDAFWLFDVPSMRAMYVSPAWEQIFGRPIRDVYEDYRVWLECTHPDDLHLVESVLEAAFSTGEDQYAEYRIVRPDGSIRWVADRAYSVRDTDGTIVRLVGIAEDITERRRSRDALLQSEQQVRMVIEHAPAVLWAVDEEGRFTLSEGSALQGLGLKPGEVVGQSLFELYGKYPEVVEAARRALAGETVQTLNHVDDLVFDCRYMPRTDATTGKVVGAFGVAIDVTRQERSREQRVLLERKVLEAQRLESLGVLAGGIAHDFNNLLMGVLGSADLAMSEIPIGTPGRQYLKQIETTAVRAAELTNQMLAYSGQGRFVVEPTCMNQVVREMAGLLNTVISKKAVLELDLDERLPAVEADASQMRQVVMNLITNASEALEDQAGTILVRTGHRVVAEDEIGMLTFGADLEPGPCVSFLVSDDGSGMDAETLHRIFDPFFTTKFTGRGLGLAGVLGIVRGHKGAVQVESAPGTGTSFEILLPAAEVEVVRQDVSPRQARIEAGALRVLVADDDEMVLQVASLMLETAGFEVVVAVDGQEAVDHFREDPDGIDLVLLDMTMPRLSGEEAFEAIRSLRPEVPVILSSGYTEQEARRRLEGEGVAGFVQKPYRAVDLLGAIQEVMRLRARPDLKP